MYDCIIVSVAYKLNDKLKNRLIQFIRESHPSKNIGVYFPDHNNCNPVTNGVFNKCKALNGAIIKLANMCQYILCCDIDVLIPPNFVDITVNKSKNTPTHCYVRWIDESDIYPRMWEEWKNYEIRVGSWGGWTCMSVSDWYKSGGWNEDLYGWGSEDYEFHMRLRAKNMGAYSFRQVPLMHITHDPRCEVSPRRGFENKKTWMNDPTRLKRNWIKDHVLDELEQNTNPTIIEI